MRVPVGNQDGARDGPPPLAAYLDCDTEPCLCEQKNNVAVCRGGLLYVGAFFFLHAWGDMIDGVIHGLPLQESLQRGENAMGG